MKKVLLDRVLHATNLMTLANIVNLFEVTQKESFISDKTKALIKKSMRLYDAVGRLRAAGVCCQTESESTDSTLFSQKKIISLHKR